MNPISTNAKSQTLRVLPKAPRPTKIERHLQPKRGLLWSHVTETFIRFDWDIVRGNALFIIVHHPATGETMHISRMRRGHVLINQDYAMLAVDDLTDLEILADVVVPPTRKQSVAKPKFRHKMQNLIRRFLKSIS